MPKAETTIDIAAPPEHVFELLMDPSRLGEWVTASRSVSGVPDGGLKAGSSFTQRLSLARSEFAVRWRIDELERPRLAVWSGEGPKGTTAHVRYEIEPAGDGARFRYVNEYELPGGFIGNVAGRVSSRAAERAMKSSLKKLKRLAES
jgi:carbon monoxide dehydrogenase subunit G